MVSERTDLRTEPEEHEDEELARRRAAAGDAWIDPPAFEVPAQPSTVVNMAREGRVIE